MKIQTALPAIGIVALLGMAACSGFDFERFVKVNVPLGIQQSEGLPSKIALADSKSEFAAWADDVKREAAEWRAANERGAEIVAVFNSVSQAALDEYGPALAGIPLGPVGAVGLAGVLGLLIKRPGDRTTAEAQAKADAAWDEAYKAGLAAAGGKS